MSDFYDGLRELVDWRADPEALVLSLYLDVSPGAEARALAFARERCAPWLDPGGDGRARAFGEVLRGVLVELETLVREARADEYLGVALFASAEPLLHREVRLRFPFENQCQVGRDPFLRQLLFYAEEYERSVCVVASDAGVELCEVHVGDVGRTRRIQATHGRTPGEELNAVLLRLLQEDPALHVILVGAAASRAAVEADLGAVVLERVIDRIEVEVGPRDPRFLPAVHRSLQAYERRTEEAGVAALLRGREEHGAVALGLRETLEAINRGRIRTLYMLRSFTEQAWLCDACDYLAVLPAPPACVACGASVSVVPVEEHLLDQAAACGAVVETVLASEVLARAGGVGARLDAGEG